MKVYIYASGGYRNISAEVFTTYDEAYQAMKEDYEDVKSSWAGFGHNDDEYCFIDKNEAEVYFAGMSCEEAWSAVIQEQDI